MNSSVEEKIVEREIKDALLELGVRPNLKGFWYALDCVKIIMQKGLHSDIKLMSLYEEVSKKHGVSCGSVEKGVGRLAKRIYDYGDFDAITRILGSSAAVMGGLIKPGEFLWTLADYVDYITTQEETGNE